MPIPTPFHARTAELCTSLKWKEWAGYYAVCSYAAHHEAEYHAVRHACGVIDVTPLCKYEVKGPDAAEFLAYLTVRDVRALKRGRVTYLCWCDDDGNLLDDGTVSRLDDETYRLTAALPQLHWLLECAEGFDVSVRDESEAIAALALQGPTARALLSEICDASLDRLRFFRHKLCTFAGDIAGEITRTGYTGDLGYELWVDAEQALPLWDALFEAGRSYGLSPLGLDALDMLRIEAGFVLNGVDYYSAREALIPSQKSTPFEAGLGWTVDLEREDGLPFVGQAALRASQQRTDPRAPRLVGVEVSWEAIEALYAEYGLPPGRAAAAWRSGVPIYDDQLQVGRGTSGTWSPLLKRDLVLAQVESRCAEPGTELLVEMTVEYERRRVAAHVVELPFYDPPRKRAVLPRPNKTDADADDDSGNDKAAA